MNKLTCTLLLVCFIICFSSVSLANSNQMMNLNNIDNLEVDKSEVSSISFLNNSIIPENAEFIRDISLNEEQTIHLYYIYDESKDCYDMYINSDDTIELIYIS